MTARVRFADLHAVTRSVTLDAPISATAILAEIAEALVRTALADHPEEKNISLLAISVSQLETDTRNCSSSSRLGSRTRRAAPAAERAWRVTRPIAPSTRSAIASDGTRSDMAPRPWEISAPSPTSFASSPNGISEQAAARESSQFP